MLADEGHLGLYLLRGRVSEVVLHPAWAALGLGNDVGQQLLTPHAWQLLHAHAHTRRVAAEGAVAAVGGQGEHVHIAVMEGLAGVVHGGQQCLGGHAAPRQAQGRLDQGHGLLRRALLQPKARHRP